MSDTAPPVPTKTQADALLSAAPSIVAPASQPGDSLTGVPQQKVLAAAVGALVAYVLVKYTGISIPPELVAGVVAALLAMFVPASKRDIRGAVTDADVHALMRDPASNVSYVQTPVQPRLGDPAVIVPPAQKEV